jgi:D-beta-D-heptose 7-phosphate kinase/D-beta-D-heptose 1-phosphate adenosyltransferase
LEKISEARILVAGDFFLDRYCRGSVSRLSPEAPVPVLKVSSEDSVPGGAANVASNLLALGCNVAVCGVVGDDSDGALLKEMLHKMGARTDSLLQAANCKTIVKTRVVGNRNQQFVRLDFNEDGPFPETDGLLGCFRDAQAASAGAARAGEIDLAVLSDYGKGFCSRERTEQLIALCRRRGVPVIVDPKGTDWDKYRGAAWITPNFSEFSAISGVPMNNTDESVGAHIAKIAERFGIGNTLVTRSECGMTLCRDDGRVRHFRAKAIEVSDVSGAGDTTVAALGALLASGADAEQAVGIANVAAGIAVGKRGTAVVSRAELAAALRTSRLERISAKIMDWGALFGAVASWKAEGKTIAVANGCFDIFHKGHASLILAASEFCDRLIVAINADDTVRKLKGPGRPVNREEDRAFVLAALEHVDAVVIFREDTPEELLRRVSPDVLVKGGEYSLAQVPGRQYAKRVELVEYIDGYSTTAIIKRSKEDETA